MLRRLRGDDRLIIESTQPPRLKEGAWGVRNEIFSTMRMDSARVLSPCALCCTHTVLYSLARTPLRPLLYLPCECVRHTLHISFRHFARTTFIGRKDVPRTRDFLHVPKVRCESSCAHVCGSRMESLKLYLQSKTFLTSSAQERSSTRLSLCPEEDCHIHI